MNTCAKCDTIVNSKYCHNCGQATELKRIDKRYIIGEIVDFFFANKGFVYTVKQIVVRPGEAVRRFLKEDRHRFVKPITFIVITSLIHAIVHQVFNVNASDYHMQSLEEGSTVDMIMGWITVYYPGYSNIISGLLVAFLIKLFFKKYGYNIFEIFVLICFTTGITMLISSFIALIQTLTTFKIVQFATYIDIVYMGWAIGQFFDRKKISSYIRAFLSYLLSALILGYLILIMGMIIDVSIK
jgi:hypothetical protein